MPSLFTKAITRLRGKVATQTQQYKQQREKRKNIDMQAKEIEKYHQEQAYRKEKLKLARKTGTKKGKSQAQRQSNFGGLFKNLSEGSTKIVQSGAFDVNFFDSGSTKRKREDPQQNFMGTDPFQITYSQQQTNKRRKRKNVENYYGLW